MTQVRQRDIALILARELAANLVTPIMIWDGEGALVYFNEAAEPILGMRLEEMGGFRVEELPRFQPEDLDGNPIDVSNLAAWIALSERRPAHRVVRITGMDGVRRTIEATAFPLLTRGDEFVGAVAIFWERGEDS